MNKNTPPEALRPLLRSLRADLRRDVREAVREELSGHAHTLRSESEDAGRLVTKEEVADRLRCSERTVDTLAAEGSLCKIKVGRLVRFSPEAVDAYIRRQAGAGSS